MMRTMARLPTALVALLVTTPAFAATLNVGPGQTYAKPCQAIAAASDGDTILIDAAGNYDGDVCAIPENDLTIRGVNGRPHIDAAGQAYGHKAIWVVNGNNVTIDNVELSGCQIAANYGANGAGIRAQGGDLTVKNSYIHDNQDGILTSSNPSAHITLEGDEFYQNGSGDWGYTHNLYIGHIGRFTMIGCWSHALAAGPDAGHLVKSRAAYNEILYNRITDDIGTSSRQIDLPNGGESYVIGNLLQQGAHPKNKQMIAYLEEGANPANPDHHLYVVGNTFVNDAGSGTFVYLGNGSQATVQDNLFVGGGTVSNGQPSQGGNLQTNQPMLVDRAGFDYHLLATSPAIDQGIDPGKSFDGYALTPTKAYRHPTATVPRPADGTLDVGAYEYATAAGADGGVADGGGTDAGAADAGTVDGGTSMGDAGTPPAGGSDGGTASGQDAGPTGQTGGNGAPGCGCSAARGGSGAGLLLLGLGLVALGRRRRAAP